MYLIISIGVFLDSFFSMLLGPKFLGKGANVDVLFAAHSVVTVIEAVPPGQLLIIYSAFGKYLRKNGNTMKQCISSL